MALTGLAERQMAWTDTVERREALIHEVERHMAPTAIVEWCVALPQNKEWGTSRDLQGWDGSRGQQVDQLVQRQ